MSGKKAATDSLLGYAYRPLHYTLLLQAKEQQQQTLQSSRVLHSNTEPEKPTSSPLQIPDEEPAPQQKPLDQDTEVGVNPLLRTSIAEDSALTLSRPSSIHLEPTHDSKLQEEVGTKTCIQCKLSSQPAVRSCRLIKVHCFWLRPESTEHTGC